ncbi:MAG: amidohydrolase [Dehalococcoidales bacterium]|nr:amidohydrolase [Dehalococcoidales bacterium]
MNSKNELFDILMPDLIISNGRVITVDKDFSIAEAVAVKNGKIMAVGTSDEIKSITGKRTRVVDLKGATMLPGINDSHCHVSDWALTRPPWKLFIRFPVVKSIADIVGIVAEAAGKASPGEWVQGEGWDQGYLDECLANPDRLPSKEDLDRVAPDNPVVLVEYSGHRMWVNSKALEMAGIRDDTPDPVGGRIGRDHATGKCTGLLYEKADMPVRQIIPPWTAEQRMKALPEAMAELNSLGITSFTDAGVERDKWACYNDTFNRHSGDGKWTCRVNMLLHMGERGKFSLEAMKEAFKHIGCSYNFGNEWLKVGGVKFLGDGIPPLKTACMFEPYPDGTFGLLETDGTTLGEQEQSLREMIKLVHSNRLQVGIHSTGERTIHIITDQYMKCIEQDPWDARHYVIHSDFSRLHDIEKIRDFAKRTGYEIGMNVQSSIKWTISDLMETVVGKERAAYHWPLRTMLDHGIRVANSSDAPVIYPDWRPGIQAAVLRESKATGKISGPEQRITVAEAIATYTINGAWLDHMEELKGSIEAGKLADFCIIDNDILTIDPHKIQDIRILMTISGGNVVYNAGVL